MSTTSIICLALAGVYALFLIGFVWFVHRFEEDVHARENRARRDADRDPRPGPIVRP